MDVDAAYVINLDSAPGRLDRIARQAAAAGLPDFQRIRGVDGSDAAEIESRTSDLHPMCRAACSPGALGCALSHLDAWRICLARGHGAALILEDDAVLGPGFLDEARAALRACPADFDILLLGHRRADLTPTGGMAGLLRGEPRWVNDLIVEPPVFYGTHCYLVSRQGAAKLATWKVAFQVDIQLATDDRVKVYATARQLATQEGRDSHVRPRAFPQTVNGILGFLELPPLNMLGRSGPHPAAWVPAFLALGLWGAWPWAVLAFLAVEALLGPSPWWAAAALAWLGGLATRRLL